MHPFSLQAAREDTCWGHDASWTRLRRSKRLEAASGDALAVVLSLYQWTAAQGRHLVQARDVPPVAARLRRVSWIPSGSKEGPSPTGVPCADAHKQSSHGVTVMAQSGPAVRS
ncbi:hypothetical protein PMIN06_011132 [Paraphaeosphaeria minitans]